jgi:hypothetical protein
MNRSFKAGAGNYAGTLFCNRAKTLCQRAGSSCAKWRERRTKEQENGRKAVKITEKEMCFICPKQA